MIYILRFVILLASLAGFLLAFYIHNKKNRQEALVCPIGSDCNAVVNSQFSKFFGIPVEFLGMIYYGVIFVSFSLITAFNLNSPSPAFTLILITTTAFLFSIYLITIQAVAIKQWCTWCLSSAFLSTLIFAASFAASDWSFVELLFRHQGQIFLIHLIGIALAMGAATIADLLFLKFLKDFKITEAESDILKTFAQILWFSLAIVVITSLGLYLPNSTIAWSSPQFVAEMFILFIVVLNAVYLTLIVYPHFIELSFDHESTESRQKDRSKKTAFASGAVSIASWYTLFFLVSPMQISLSTARLILAYIGIIIVAVSLSQIVHNIIEEKAKRSGY